MNWLKVYKVNYAPCDMANNFIRLDSGSQRARRKYRQSFIREFSMARPFRITGLQWLFNRIGDFYELYLAFIFPARDLYFTVQVLK